MKKFLIVLFTLMFALAATDALAKKRKKKKKKKRKKAESSYVMPYGMAGCGLGSMLIRDNNIMQVLAATTNGSSYSQSFGITTGTSNCTASGAQTAMEQKVFMQANVASLSVEAAQGSGDNLHAFAELLGCDHEMLAQVSQAHYGELFQDRSPDGVLNRYHARLSGKCQRTI